MATKGLQSFSRSVRTLRVFGSCSKDPLAVCSFSTPKINVNNQQQCLSPRFSRSMATETTFSSDPLQGESASFIQNAADPVADFLDPTVLTTIYKFPTMEPLRFESYNSKHLHLPLRRDILHRAVVFEGDATRQGTASSKTRFEVHGGHRKIRPQKGSGRARLGTRQSPMLRGGGKSFGPHPRDFSSLLPRKMYDLAWRTALSWRYRRGELIICEDGVEIEHAKAQFVRQIFEHNHWGKEDGRSLIVAEDLPPNLTNALQFAGDQGRVKTVTDVDVKDLLELGRIIIEKRALDRLLSEHESDLVSNVRAVV